MADVRELRNYINGEFKPSREGETLDIVNPSTGAVYATSPRSGGRRRRRRDAGRPGRVRRRLARHHAQRADGLPAQDGGRDRGERGGPRRRRGGEHGQAQGPDHERRDPADVRPDPLLRRRRPHPRGQGDRRVHARLHVLDPARADRRDRLGGAVELPDDDGRVEVRAGARGGQHDRAQAVRHDAGQHRADGRAVRRDPAAGRVQRRLRRPRHRRGGGQPPDPADGLDHGQHRRPARRSHGPPPTPSSAAISSWAARRP